MAAPTSHVLVATDLSDQAGLAVRRAAQLGEQSHCLWWTGAVSGRGHGRFWFGRGRVVIAHRFAFALAYGVEALDQVRVLGHRCDNPLCQRVGPGHVVASSAARNRREWVIRRLLAGSPLAGSAFSFFNALICSFSAFVSPWHLHHL